MKSFYFNFKHSYHFELAAKHDTLRTILLFKSKCFRLNAPTSATIFINSLQWCLLIQQTHTMFDTHTNINKYNFNIDKIKCVLFSFQKQNMDRFQQIFWQNALTQGTKYAKLSINFN